MKHNLRRYCTSSLDLFSKAIYRPELLVAQIIVITAKYILVLFTNGFHNITKVFILIDLLHRNAVVIYPNFRASSKAHHLGLCFIDNHLFIEQYYTFVYPYNTLIIISMYGVKHINF